MWIDACPSCLCSENRISSALAFKWTLETRIPLLDVSLCQSLGMVELLSNGIVVHSSGEVQ